MATAVFDTLKLAQALRDQAKFTPEQAEGAAHAIADAMHSEIATKPDLQVLETNLPHAITESAVRMLRVTTDLEMRLSKMIKDSEFGILKMVSDNESEILKFVSGIVGFQTLAIIGTGLVLAHR